MMLSNPPDSYDEYTEYAEQPATRKRYRSPKKESSSPDKRIKMQPALAPAPHMLRQSAQDASSANAEQALRDQLLQHVGNSKIDSKKIPSPYQDSKGGSAQHNIDPAIAGPPTAIMSHSPADSAGDDTPDGKKSGKRELSTSKRAAQNRAAQRAFRQRKEGHIKKLEEQVRDYNALSESYKLIQAENYQLRDYIINLQSKLIESQNEFPPAPVNIDLHHRPGADGLPHLLPTTGPTSHSHPAAAPTAPMAASDLSRLQASAAQTLVDAERPDVAMQDRTDPALTT